MFDLYDAVHSARRWNVTSRPVPHLFFFFFGLKSLFDFPVRSFLVDACMKLLAHVETEGLFRKSGSVVRLKALRVSDA